MVDGIVNFDIRLYFLRIMCLGIAIGLWLARLMLGFIPEHILDRVLFILSLVFLIMYLALRAIGT